MVRSADVSWATENRSGFVYSDGASRRTKRHWHYKENSSAEAFWCPDESWAAQNPRCNSQKHATKQDKTVQTHAYNMPTCWYIFFQYPTKTLQIFSRTCQCRRDLLPFQVFRCITSKQQLMCFGLQDKTGHFLLIMPQKNLFLTNAARGCCYWQPFFFYTVKSITVLQTTDLQQIWKSARNPTTRCKSIIHLRRHQKRVKVNVRHDTNRGNMQLKSLKALLLTGGGHSCNIHG